MKPPPYPNVPGTGPFDPATLFVGGVAGEIWLVDPLYTFKDTAGTVPSVVGQGVARVNGRINNNHLLQATAGLQPILRQTGAYYYLEFDGVDDYLRAAFAIAQPWDRISAVQQISWTAGRFMYGGVTANAGVMYQNAVTPELTMYDSAGAPILPGVAVATDAVITESHNAPNSRAAVDNVAYVTGNSSNTAPGGVTVGNNDAGAASCNIRFYGAIMRAGAMDDPSIAAMRTYMGARQGRVL